MRDIIQQLHSPKLKVFKIYDFDYLKRLDMKIAYDLNEKEISNDSESIIGEIYEVVCDSELIIPDL